jgi:transposase
LRPGWSDLENTVRAVRQQWKLARELVTRFDTLAFETLNLDGMRRLWGRKVSDLGFGDFLLKVEWMAGKFGKAVIKIYPFEPNPTAFSRGSASSGSDKFVDLCEIF